jgi:hypothetical protein
MKNFITALLITFIPVLQSNAFIFTENFDYPPGDLLRDHWISIAPVGVSYMSITGIGLSFPDYANSGVGRAAKIDTSGPDANAVFFDYAGITSGNLYHSFMLNTFSARQEGDCFAGIVPTVLSTPPFARVYVRDSSGHLSFGIAKSSETPVYTTAKYSKNATYLIVAKYAFAPGAGNDLVSLFVYSDPPPYAEPAPDAGPVGAGIADIGGACAFALYQCYQSNSFGAVFDGLYIDDTWDNTVLPVELSGFSASAEGNDVTLFWSTSREMNNSGFDLERKSAHSALWMKAGSVKGRNTAGETQHYSFTDRNLAAGSYNYRLKQTDFSGGYEYFCLKDEIIVGAPEAFQLRQNYPNPFNPVTVIEFDLPEDAFVGLVIYDASGKEIETLADEFRTAGYHAVSFNASNLPGGVYFCRLVCTASGGNQYASAVKKMILIK